ncbi:hypothetical protein RISK_001807 [Rhodopirellula islandica]|uniref:Transmembrane protein n=1 Tax=Rhodopirellula islandica TaxID=595434 RepID=A0A0J1BHE1_RHOIS|nr:hypothetical protein [Rhodopirellula islandica]KLU05956.1 hypothetical protein RISK_001807 [Rhodopirellula islandica]
MTDTEAKQIYWFTTFLVAFALCSITVPVAFIGARYNVVAVVSVVVVFTAWTVIGRKWFRSGFYFFFDFLSFQVFIAGLIVFGIAVYRWASPWFAA